MTSDLRAEGPPSPPPRPPYGSLPRFPPPKSSLAPRGFRRPPTRPTTQAGQEPPGRPVKRTRPAPAPVGDGKLATEEGSAADHRTLPLTVRGLSHGDAGPRPAAAQGLLRPDATPPPPLGPRAPKRTPGRGDAQEPPPGPRPGASLSTPAWRPPPAHPRSPALRPVRRGPTDRHPQRPRASTHRRPAGRTVAALVTRGSQRRRRAAMSYGGGAGHLAAPAPPRGAGARRSAPYRRGATRPRAPPRVSRPHLQALGFCSLGCVLAGLTLNGQLGLQVAVSPD